MKNKKAATPTPERNRLANQGHNNTNPPAFQVPWTVKALANSLPTPAKKKRTASEEEDLVYDYLLTHGSLTTAEARTILGVWEPGKRVKALRERGIAIDTIYGYLLSESESRYCHTKQYILRPEMSLW